MKLKIFVFIILCAVFVFGNTTAQTGSPNTVTAAKISSPEIRQASFEKVWNTVNEKYFDETFGGVDWKKIREIYEPQAMAAKSDADFHAVLQKMLGELKVSHFAVVTPDANFGITAQSAEIGIELQLIAGKVVISRIQPGSSAAEVGLKTGFIVEKIGERTTAEIIAATNEKLAKRNDSERVRNEIRRRVLLSKINGAEKTKIKLIVSDAKDLPQNFEPERRVAVGEMSPPFGNLPPQPLEFETRKLAGNIGYIRFNIWMIAQLPKIRQAVKSFAATKGIIFDIRGNPGGLAIMAAGVAGLFSKEQTSLGTMKSRLSTVKLIVYPQPNAFTGKIVVLTNSGSASTSELFAAGIQETKRGKIIGEKTAGAILASVIDTLPTGALFQYVVSDYKSPNNILIEGRGVLPDLEVLPTRESLLAGSDAQLDAAIREITITDK